MPLNHLHKTSSNLSKRIKGPGLILRTSAYIMYSNESCDLLTLIRHINASGYTRPIICTNYSDPGQSDHSKSIFINENMDPRSMIPQRWLKQTAHAHRVGFFSFPYKLECCFTSQPDNFTCLFKYIWRLHYGVMHWLKKILVFDMC